MLISKGANLKGLKRIRKYISSKPGHIKIKYVQHNWKTFPIACTFSTTMGQYLTGKPC